MLAFRHTGPLIDHLLVREQVTRTDLGLGETRGPGLCLGLVAADIAWWAAALLR